MRISHYQLMTNPYIVYSIHTYIYIYYTYFMYIYIWYAYTHCTPNMKATLMIWIRWFGWVPITGVGRWGWLQDYYPCPKYTFFLAGGETLQQMWPVIWQSMFFYHPLWGCTMMYPVFTVWSVCTGLRDVKGYCKQCSKHKERNFHGPMVSNGQITSWYLQPSTHPKWKNKPCSRTVPACRRCRWGGATCESWEKWGYRQWR